jgi:hypothetical protein
MRRGLLAALLAIGLAWGAGASAQVATDAPGLREIAARLLAAGEAERARGLALALLARDGADVAALLLLGRAELELGDAEAALVAARRAHAEAEDGRARFTAARVAAKANADLGRWTRAQVWLRRARQDAPDAEAAAAVAQDYRAVTRRNPLAVRLSFGIAPSSNVNGGSSSETIVLPGLPFEFVLDGEARALSGLRVSAGVSLSYRLRRDEVSETAVEIQASGRTYVLSGEARDQAPDARGSDFADVAASAALVHRWRGEGASGPSSVRLTYGWTFYDSEPYSGYLQLGYDRSFALTGADRLDLWLFREWAERSADGTRQVTDPVTGEDVPGPDGTPLLTTYEFFEPYGSVGGRLRWTHALRSMDRVNLSLGLRAALTEAADASYDGVTLGGGYEWGRSVRGLRLGVSAEADWRRYELSDYSLDGRDDRTLRLRATLGLPRIDLYGFHPTASVEAFRTESDVSLYDKGGLTVDLGFRSSF